MSEDELDNEVFLNDDDEKEDDFEDYDDSEDLIDDGSDNASGTSSNEVTNYSSDKILGDVSSTAGEFKAGQAES